jgi:hypothetical protein
VGGVYRLTATGTTWHSAGLNNYNIYNLTIDPNGVIYAGTGGSGVFKSLDHGAHWTETNVGIPPSCRYIDAFAINPMNFQDLYADVSNLGVYRSKNGGAKWTYFGRGLCPQVMVFSLAFDPKDPTTLYAGTAGAGIYKIKPGD